MTVLSSDSTNYRLFTLEDQNLQKLPDHLQQNPEFQNCEGLWLSNNLFQEFPMQLVNSQQIKDLSLRANRLSLLPESIGRMAHLRELALDVNRISALPETFSQLTNLQKIGLATNAFTEFPKILLKMPQLQSIDLAANPLTALPWGIETYPALEAIELDQHEIFTDSREIVVNPKHPGVSTLQEICKAAMEKTECQTCHHHMFKSKSIHVIKPVPYRGKLVKTEAFFCSESCKSAAISLALSGV